MRRVYKWYSARSKRAKDSIAFSAAAVGLISSILTILGVSLGDLEKLGVWSRLCIVAVTYVVLAFSSYAVIGRVFRDSIQFTIHHTPVSIRQGGHIQRIGSESCRLRHPFRLEN